MICSLKLELRRTAVSGTGDRYRDSVVNFKCGPAQAKTDVYELFNVTMLAQGIYQRSNFYTKISFSRAVSVKKVLNRCRSAADSAAVFAPLQHCLHQCSSVSSDAAAYPSE